MDQFNKLFTELAVPVDGTSEIQSETDLMEVHKCLSKAQSCIETAIMNNPDNNNLPECQNHIGHAIKLIGL